MKFSKLSLLLLLSICSCFSELTAATERTYLQAKDRFQPLVVLAPDQKITGSFIKDPIWPRAEKKDLKALAAKDPELNEEEEALPESIVHIGQDAIFGRSRQASLKYYTKIPALERVDQPFLKDYEKSFLYKEPFSL